MATQKIFTKWTSVVLAVLVVLAVFVPAIDVDAGGTRCYSGTAFYKVYAGGSWHWYAYVPKNVSAPLTAWHAHGPQNAQLWPNSVTTYHVKVYFSFPNWANPYYFFRPSQFQACLN